MERWEQLTSRQRANLLRSLEKVNEMMEAENLDAAPILAPDLDPKSRAG